ncbi:MAG: CsiV family protein [Pseudomonadota bacterium]
MTRRHVLSVAIALGAITIAGHGDARAQASEDAATDEPSRYALEFIVFRYDATVSSGTEVFLPDLPETVDLSSSDPGAATDRSGAYDPFPASEDGRADDVSSFARTLPGDDEADNSDAASEAPVFGDARAPLMPDDDEARPVLPFGDDDFVTSELDAFRARNAIDMRLIPQDLLSMTDVHEKLLLLDAYEPVLWSGWTQIVVDEAFSPSMGLRRLGSPPADIDGSLTLYLGRFVHLVTDLTWSVPDPSNGFAQPDPDRSANDVPYFGDQNARFGYFDGKEDAGSVYIRYRIAEDRIMRNGDTRYFDHPRFGLIAKLTLVEPGSPLDPRPRAEVINEPASGIPTESTLLPADDSSVLQPAAPQ